MIKIIFDGEISLDSFFAGGNRSPPNPIGDNGPAIHNWMYKQKAFWENDCLKKAKSIGQKIYTKQMFMLTTHLRYKQTKK